MGAPPVVDLAITARVEPPVAAPGATVTYTLAYTNQGTAAAQNVTITATLPLAFTPTEVYAAGAALSLQDGPPYVWLAAGLAPGEGGVITIVGILAGDLAPEAALTASAAVHTPLEARPDDNVAAAVLLVSVQPPNSGAPSP